MISFFDNRADIVRDAPVRERLGILASVRVPILSKMKRVVRLEKCLFPLYNADEQLF